MTKEMKLLQAAKDGNTAAFEQIVKKYQSLICAITFSGTGRVDISEELAQETFLSAWKNLRQLTDPSGFRPWLCTIARNMLNSYYRQKKPVSLDSAHLADITDQSPTPSDNLITQEEHVMLEQSLMQIPAEYREPLVMYYRQEKSIREVAVGLDLNESTVQTRLHRARQMLREEMAARLERTLERTAPGKTFTKAVMAGIGAGLAAGVAGTASAAVATGTAGSGTATGIAAVMSTMTAKVVMGMAVAAIAIGGVVTYKHLSQPKSQPTQPDAIAVVSVEQEPVSIPDENTYSDSQEQQEAAVNQIETAEIQTAAVTSDLHTEDTPKIEIATMPSNANLASASKMDEVTPVDMDNQDENILSLKVISQETGLAVKDAPVKVRLYGDKEIKADGTTNQFGRYDFQHDQAKFRSLTITVDSEGFVPTKIDYRDNTESLKLPLNYTLSIEKGTSIGGIITNEQNQPVQGVSVSLLVPSDEQAEQPTVRPAIWDHVVMTDIEGKWHCDIMPSKLEDIWIRLSHPEYIDDTSYGATPKPSIASLRAMTGVMVMKQGLAVTGVVKDTEGNPISNAFVAQGSDRWGTHFPDTKTDKDGRFHFSNVEPGEMILTVSANGKAPDLKRIEVRPDLDDIEFRLKPGNIIRGRVVDSGGNPISGVVVAADTWRGHRSIRWRTNTNKNGHFQWNDAPTDEVLFDLVKEKYLRIRKEPLIPLSDDEEWELVMYRPLEVSGTVVDAKTGEKIQQFNLVVGMKSDAEGEVWWSNHYTKTFTNGEYTRIFSEPRHGYALRVEAEGYLPSVSRVFSPEEELLTLDFALEKGVGISGFVYLPDGSPVQGAEVMLSTQGISIKDGVFVQKREQPFYETGPDGRFSFSPQVEDFVIAVIHDFGLAKVHSSEFAEDTELVLEPWAHIEGTVYVGREIGAGETVAINRAYNNSNLEPRIHIYSKSTADQQGNFKFSRVAAGKLQIGREIKTGANTSSYTDNEKVAVNPGQTLEVKVGGKGRPVAGRLVLPTGNSKKIDWKVGWISISTKWDIESPKPRYPEGFAAMSQEEQREWLMQWRQSDELKAYREEVEAAQEQRRNYPVVMNEDGSFICDGVEAGHYQLRGSFQEPSNDRMFMGKVIGSIEVEFDVPEIPNSVSNEVLDLGSFEIEILNEIQIGEYAPNFEIEDTENQTIKLSDYRGKFVLLDVWHRQAREDAKPGLEEMARLYQQFGHDPRFVMLSITHKGSTPPELMKEYIELYDMDWEIGLYQDRKTLKGYAIQDLPSRFLIGPEGKLLGKNLKGQELTDAIKEVLLVTE